MWMGRVSGCAFVTVLGRVPLLVPRAHLWIASLSLSLSLDSLSLSLSFSYLLSTTLLPILSLSRSYSLYLSFSYLLSTTLLPNLSLSLLLSLSLSLSLSLAPVIQLEECGPRDHYTKDTLKIAVIEKSEVKERERER